MTKFLEKVADYILEDVGDNTLHTVVIFPNKRSEVFLKNHLKKKIKSNYWLPEFFTVDEFIVKNSGIVELEPVDIYFELYKIHKKIAGNEARNLDDFLAWAPIMLADFNDIDLYLADAKKVFTNLSEIRAIEQWNPSGKPLTELQKNYLIFYNSLHQYYSEINSSLLSQKQGYKGMIYKNLYENIETISKEWHWNRFILVGFNALSESEEKIFGYLNNNFKMDALFDVDEYYFGEKNQSNKEAGRFINRLANDWGIENIKWKTNQLLTDKQKEINILGIPKNIGQVKYASQLLEEWAKDNTIEIEQFAENDKLMETAVVLADERVLVPFLNSLPQIENTAGKKIPFNLTMGYPLINSPIAEFTLSWIEMLKSNENIRDDGYATRRVLKLLNNPFFRSSIDFFSKNMSQKIITSILHKNSMYLRKSDIMEIACKEVPELQPIFDLVLQKPEKPADFIDLYIEFIASIKLAISDTSASNSLLKEQIILILTLAKKLKLLLKEVDENLTFRSLEKVFNQLLSRSEINLKGEPLSGIQVMGMLETRNLDFKNLVVLSVNDGILPKSSLIESFIPFDVRRYFKLPLPKDKTDIYAYHFYRLLQRAEKINLVYNSEPDALGGGEKSRFILQLEKELAKDNTAIKPIESKIKIPVGEAIEKQEISISKTPEIIKLVKNKLGKSLSPTALTTFIACPLKFYFRYIIDIKQADTLVNNIEANVLGKVIHGILEDLLKNSSGKVIDIHKLTISDEDLRQKVVSKFDEEFEGGNIESGQNLLIVEVAIQYLKQYLKAEIKDLKSKKRIMIAAEERLEHKVEVSGININLKGFIDRTDQVSDEDTVRILDYKTGAVKKSDLQIKEWEELINNPDKEKAFQVMFYAYLFAKKKNTKSGIETGIISMRNISSGFMSLQLPNKTTIQDGIDIFEEHLELVINQIIDPSQSFNQTQDEKRCAWCEFKGICNRNPKNNF